LVSFDVFDTLVRRRLAHPDHLFALLQRCFGAQLEPRQAWVDQLQHARIHAWHLALHRARLQGRDEVTLAEIYAVVAAILPAARPHLETLVACELELEAAFIEAHPPGLALMQLALEQGKRVVLCSDQYMPRSFLEPVLERCGVRGHDHFFLSSELGVLKATGRLYDWLVIRTGVRRDQILHIGDNPYVDGEVAARAGLRSLLLPNVMQRHDPAIASSALLRHPSLCSVAFALHYGHRADVSGGHSAALSLGYCLLGPLVVELCRWIARRLDQGELDRVWFLARDGQVVHRAFLHLFPEHAHRVDYVWASRKLLVYGTSALEPEEVLRHYNHLFDAVPSLPLVQAIGQIFPDMSLNVVQETCLQQGLPPDQPASRSTALPVLRRLIALQRQDPPARVQLVREYLLEKAGDARTIGLFDLGWRANLQRGIESILQDHSAQFTGLYFGQIFEDELCKPLVHAESFAFNLNFPITPFHRIAPRQWLIEPLFAGTHPSVIGLHRQQDGSFEPLYEQRTPAVERQLVDAQKLQNEVMQFILDARCQGIALQDLGSRSGMLEVLQEFLAHPTRFDVQAYLNSEWMIGIDQETPERFVQPLPPTPCRRDVEQALAGSLWKEGFRVWHGPDRIDQLLRIGQRRQRVKRKLKQVLRRVFKRVVRGLKL